MKRALLLLLVFVTFSAYSQEHNFLEKPYLQTTATYTTEVVPDQIYLSIIISEKDTKGKIPVEELENRMMIKLKALGINTQEQLSLSDLSSDFRKYLLKKKDVLKDKSYLLLVNDANTAGKVLKELEMISISNVNLQKVDYSKMEELKIELRGKAVAKAKRQAESLLNPLGQVVGKAVFISDNNPEINSRRVRLSASNSFYAVPPMDFTDPSTDFERIKIQSEVTVFFEIL
ncbi:MAG: hypothetical protein Aureis2KO_14960 [Aureisphaera sp.]